jgi:hypothetical protein
MRKPDPLLDRRVDVEARSSCCPLHAHVIRNERPNVRAERKRRGDMAHGVGHRCVSRAICAESLTTLAASYAATVRP